MLEWKIWWIVAERDVLVAPTVTAGEVSVEQLVVVGAGGWCAKSADAVVQRPGRGTPAAPLLSTSARRVGVVSDVGEERVSKCTTLVGTVPGGAGCPRPGRRLRSTYCGRPCGPGMNCRTGRPRASGRSTSPSSSRPSISAACFLVAAHVAMPGSCRQAATRDEQSGRSAKCRRATCRSNRACRQVQGVLTQEHLVRRVGGVGLALVDPRSVGVVGVLDVVGGAEDAVRPGWFWARVSTMKRGSAASRRRCRRCRRGRAGPAGRRPSAGRTPCRRSSPSGQHRGRRTDRRT